MNVVRIRWRLERPRQEAAITLPAVAENVEHRAFTRLKGSTFRLLRQPIEQVLRDSCYVGIVATESVSPVSRATREGGAPSGIEPHNATL